MATTNFQTVSISGGAITLTGSPTGSGIYSISNAAAVTTITGGSGGAIITLKPLTAGVYFTLADNGTSILLHEHLGFAPQSIRDFITLRSNSAGTEWTEFQRGQFP